MINRVAVRTTVVQLRDAQSRLETVEAELEAARRPWWRKLIDRFRLKSDEGE